MGVSEHRSGARTNDSVLLLPREEVQAEALLRRRTRQGLSFCLAALFALIASVAAADELSVPVDLQVELLSRIVRYERSFAAESTPVRVLVVTRPSSPESVRVGAQLVSRLRSAGRLGGRPMTVDTTAFVSASALSGAVRASSTRLLYLAPGLGTEARAIATSVSGQDVITVSAVGGDADRGMVLGFELVSSRPRVAVNLASARAQRLQFSAQFLRLARVVR